MTYLDNIELLKTAIDHYSLLNKTQKNVLKQLIQVCIDGESIISIKELCNAVQTTSAPVSKAITYLEELGVIESISRRGVVFGGCKIKQSKLNEIVERYKAKQPLLKKK